MADYDLKSITADSSFADGNVLFGADDQSAATPVPYTSAGLKTWILANKLSAFAATTSAELAGVISDETGSGPLVFAASPTFTGVVTIPNGAVGAPGLAFSAGATTGLYATSTNIIFVRGAASTTHQVQFQFSAGSALVFATAFSDYENGDVYLSRETNGRWRMGASFNSADGSLSLTGIFNAGDLTFSVAAKGPILKQGANGRVGTFVANGATPVTVSNTSIAINDAIIISLNAVGGTVGAHPAIQTITAATGFTVAGTAGDTSTYNYAIIKNA